MTYQASDFDRANQLNPTSALFERFCGKLRREGSILAGVCPFHGGDSSKVFADGTGQ